GSGRRMEIVHGRGADLCRQSGQRRFGEWVGCEDLLCLPLGVFISKMQDLFYHDEGLLPLDEAKGCVKGVKEGVHENRDAEVGLSQCCYVLRGWVCRRSVAVLFWSAGPEYDV
ncbi:hypothetical protein L7F22_059809, partial [Adiantum nelumboides]|nr:hypothetical protein [Adiantum nelumboides]